MNKLVQRFKDLFSKDFIITVVGQIIVVLVVFFTNKILSNYVSTDEFGAYNIAKRFTDVLTYIILLAMGIAIPKYLASYKANNDDSNVHLYWVASLLLILIASIIVTIAVWAARNPLMKLMFGASGYEKYALTSLLYAVGASLYTLISSYYRGVGYYYKYNILQILSQIIYFVVVLIVSSSAFLILLISALAYLTIDITLLIYYFIKNKKITFQYRSLKNYSKPMKELVTYGLPRVPGEFVLFAYNLIPLVIISNKFDLTQSAFFSATLAVNSTVTSAFGFIGIMLLPAVSSAIATRQFKKVDKNITFLAILYIVISAFGILLIYFCGEWLIKLLYNADYIPAVPMLIVTSVAVLPRSLFLLLRNPIDAASKLPFNTINLAVSFAVTCIGMLLTNSIMMCAWIFVIGYCVLAVASLVTWLFCRKRILKADNTGVAAENEGDSEIMTEHVNESIAIGVNDNTDKNIDNDVDSELEEI